MKRDQKLISLEKAEEVIAEFLKGGRHLSLSDFIRKYYDTFAGSHKNIKEIHEYLRMNGIDVGSYQVFRRIYYRIRQEFRSGKKPVRNPETDTTPDHPVSYPKLQKQTAQPQPLPPKTNAGLRPITLPDGTPVDIDPETGAKKFKI